MIIVIFGVAGSGKTTIGKLLAKDLGWEFIEADDFHSAANIEKMKRGEALTDEDRQPWLESLRRVIEETISAKRNAVLACSALKRKYRDLLRVSSKVQFVYLHGDHDRIAEQLKNRRGHFFDPKLLDSQFDDLEEPKSPDDALTVDLSGEPRDMVAKIKKSLRV